MDRLELSQKKLDWLISIGAIDISKYKYLVPHNGHLYSLDYLQNNSLEDIKSKYESLYAKRRKDKCLRNLCNKRDR